MTHIFVLNLFKFFNRGYFLNNTKNRLNSNKISFIMHEHLLRSNLLSNRTRGELDAKFYFRGLEICQLKNDIETNFTSIEQAILEMPVSPSQICREDEFRKRYLIFSWSNIFMKLICIIFHRSSNRWKINRSNRRNLKWKKTKISKHVEYVSLFSPPQSHTNLSILQKEISDLINQFKEHMSQHTTIFKDMSSVLKSLLKVSSIFSIDCRFDEKVLDLI